MKRSPLKRHAPVRIRRGMKRTPARQEARGKPCMVRLPGCDGGGETTVLAHYRLAGTCGVGTKPPDEQAAWACHHCHAIVDGRAWPPSGYTTTTVRLAHAEGVLRTQYERRRLS